MLGLTGVPDLDLKMQPQCGERVITGCVIAERRLLVALCLVGWRKPSPVCRSSRQHLPLPLQTVTGLVLQDHS